MKQTKVATLSSIINNLAEIEVSKIGQFIKNIQIIEADVLNYCIWDKEQYTRVCLHCSETTECLLLCWEAGQSTPIHNHNGQKCWVLQLVGEIEEKKYNLVNSKPQLANTNLLQTGECSYIDDAIGWHCLCNNTNSRSVSLHIYINPISECLVFNETENQMIVKKLDYNNKPVEVF